MAKHYGVVLAILAPPFKQTAAQRFLRQNVVQDVAVNVG
jgi:hypothetical protein